MSNLSWFIALSIVAPHGSNVAKGKKTLEVRKWVPTALPLLNLLVVENGRRLTTEADADPDGRVVAVVDVHEVHAWRPDELTAACGREWAQGYWAWELRNVRPLTWPVAAPAKLGLYKVQVECPAFSGWWDPTTPEASR